MAIVRVYRCEDDMEKPKRDFSTDPALQRPCPVCGGTEFEWGRSNMVYRAGTGWFAWRSPTYSMARRCVQCNNVLSFLSEDLSRQQNQIALAVIIFAILCMGLTFVAAVLIPLLMRR